MSEGRLSRWIFDAVHRQNLVYNQCWEDPAVDQAALRLRPEDRVLVITSAGCNALDYAAPPPELVKRLREAGLLAGVDHLAAPAETAVYRPGAVQRLLARAVRARS